MTVWNEQYSLGHGEFDTHHEHIIHLVNALESAATTGVGFRTADLVATHLLRYISRHFEQEERQMATSGYPGLAVHRFAHAALRREAAEMAGALECGRLRPEAIQAFLRDWLDSHVRTFDREYVAFLNSRH